jgi:CRP-like cAMP-binding protein
LESTGKRSQKQILELRNYFAQEQKKFLLKFSNLDDQTVDLLMGSLSLLKLHKNEMVFDYGDQGDQFYVLLDGKVSLYIPTEERVQLDEIVLGSIESANHTNLSSESYHYRDLNLERTQLYLLGYFLKRFEEISWLSIS